MNAIDGFVEQVKKHTHAPFAKGCELIKVRASNKRKASTTHDTTQQILGTKLVYLTPTAAVNLPNLRNLRRNNRRQWQEQNILPNAPREEDVPVLPHKYQMAGGGERFLFFDNGLGDSNKTFIFATNDGIDILVSGLVMVPSNFTLRYILKYIQFMYWSVKKLYNVFALLSSKTEKVYGQSFTTVCKTVRIGNG